MSIWKDTAIGSKICTHDDLVVRSRMGHNETVKTLRLPGLQFDQKPSVVNVPNHPLSKQGD